MKRAFLIALAGILAAAGIAGALRADAQQQLAAAGGTVTFQMNRLDSVRAFWARYYGQVLPYRESGEEELQDSIARCMLAYLKYKMKRLDTVILYAGREPGDETHLICHVFPVDEPTHALMCAGIGMAYVSSDAGKYELTCGAKGDERLGVLPPHRNGASD